jgi:hypothetical protein
MSEKITKSFTFQAPKKMYDLESNDMKTVTSTYKGAADIWIYVDADTGLNPQFMSEGDLPDPTCTEKYRSMLLSADNDNHIILMDMLKGSTGHNSEEIIEYFNEAGDVSLNPNLVFSNKMLVDSSAFETFDIKKTKIDENNIVYYHYRTSEEHYNKEEFLEIVRVFKLRTEEYLRDPLISTNPAAKAVYEKFIAILDYINDDLIERVEPWKIAIPQLHEL